MPARDLRSAGILFARGRVELLDTLMFAVVGTRRPTPTDWPSRGASSADLAIAGLTIVSGMARGIDTAAHKAALAAGGDTVAVLAVESISCILPENRKLAADLAEEGLVLSEFPMGSTRSRRISRFAIASSAA